jgi:hypothetical protein
MAGDTPEGRRVTASRRFLMRRFREERQRVRLCAVGAYAGGTKLDKLGAAVCRSFGGRSCVLE